MPGCEERPAAHDDLRFCKKHEASEASIVDPASMRTEENNAYSSIFGVQKGNRAFADGG